MPMINPFFDEAEQNKPDEVTHSEIEALSSDEVEEDAICREVLEDANIIPKSQRPEHFKKILNYSGASIEDAARTIADVMRSAKFENSKLKAAEIILDLHGVRDKEGSVKPQPVFQFMIKDSSINLNSVFAPNRESVSFEEKRNLLKSSVPTGWEDETDSNKEQNERGQYWPGF